MRYQLDSRSGLVLEGGGMRGVFTSGVLDNLLDRGIRFPYAVGVSAGACNGLSYISGQRGRSKYSNIDLLEQYRYIGIGHLLRKGNIMDFDLLFDEFTEHIYPFDFQSFFESGQRFEMVTTDCMTGEACYMEEYADRSRLIAITKASSSLPFLCPIVEVDNRPMLDGGIVDSFPLLRAREQGFTNNLVVLTRNRGYRKPSRPLYVPWGVYRKYPELRQRIAARNQLYNDQLDMIDAMEDRGEITVIRPPHPLDVSRIEKDTSKLRRLYDEGYACADRLQIVAG